PLPREPRIAFGSPASAVAWFMIQARSFPPSDTYMIVCARSGEKAIYEADPFVGSAAVPGTTGMAVTKAPAFVKTLIRSLPRSQAYTIPLLGSATQFVPPVEEN